MKQKAWGTSGVSKFIPLTRLLQIKKDNYLGEGGKDYCPFELEAAIIERKNSLADKQVLAVERWERTLANYQFHESAEYCPEPPKVTEKPAIQFIILF